MSRPVANFDERFQALVHAAMAEDLGDGDHSTLAVIPADAMGKAQLKIKQAGILAGVEIAEKNLSCRRIISSFSQ